MARAHFALGETELALLCFDKARTTDGLSADLYNDLGVELYKGGDVLASEVAFHRAQLIEPRHVEAGINHGALAFEYQLIEQARYNFSAALSSDPYRFEARLGMAMALPLDEGERLYLALSEECADPIPLLHVPVLKWVLGGDFQRAKSFLTEVVEAGPAPPSMHTAACDAWLASYVDAIDKWLEQRSAKDFAYEEEERKRREAEARKQAREAEQRQAMEGLKLILPQFQAEVEALADCEYAVEIGAVEMAMMIAEQAQMVVEADEIGMAEDITFMIEDIQGQLDGLWPECVE